MTFEPVLWKDRQIERPNTFTIKSNQDGTITLIPVPGTVFQQGTALSAQTLNDMQGKIKGAIDTVSSSLVDVDTKVNSLASGSPKGTYATVSALTTAKPTGDSSVYVVTADGGWYYWNGSAWAKGGTYQSTGIAEGQINFDLLNTDVKGKVLEGVNIFSKETTMLKQKLLLSTGEVIYNLANGVSDFIEVIPNQYYTLPYAFNDAGCFYDKNKNYISGITFISGSTFKVPSTAKYIRLTINLTDSNSIININKYMVVFGKIYPSQYIEYGAESYSILVGEKQIKEKAITSKHIREIKNLFDKSKVTSGYIDNSGNVLTSTSLGYSDYIPVESNNAYSIPYLSSVAGGYYDTNKVWLSAITEKSFVPQSNVAYVRVNVNINDPANVINKDKYMLVKDSTYPSKYVPYNTAFAPWLLETYIPPKNSKWNGKIIYSFGDSITWYDGNPYGGSHAESGNIAKGYLSYMREELGATVNNYGISGATIQNGISNNIKSKNYTSVDAVTITGGVNDWATTSSPPPLGAIAPIASNFDLTTTYGALQSAIEYILTSNPKIKIYLFTPIRGYLKPESSNPKAGQEFPETYANMFKEVGKLYGIPVCDWYNQVGFNKVNYPSWYKDTGSLNDRFIHVGDDGYIRMAQVGVPFLRDN